MSKRKTRRRSKRDEAVLDMLDAMVFLRDNGGIERAVRELHSGPDSALAEACGILGVPHDHEQAAEAKRAAWAAYVAIVDGQTRV